MLKSFFEDKFVPVAAKIAKQRHLLAMRDGLVLSLPLLIVGSMFIIIGELPIQAYQDFMTSFLGEGWNEFVWNDIFPATTDIIALLAAFGIAKSLVDSYDIDGVPAGVISVSLFFLLNTLDVENNTWNADLFGAVNVFTAIIVALLSAEVYRLIVQKDLVIHMPSSVPPSISRSFTALVPAAVLIVLGFIVKFLFTLTPYGDFPGFVSGVLSAPLQTVGTTYPGMLIILFFEQLLWSLGIHGSTIAWSFVDPIIQVNTVENLAAFHAGEAIPHVVAQPFIDNFLQIGGSGATLPLVVFLLLFAKSRQLKDIGRLSAAPSIFNVNEPVVFGLPIVMNPFLMIPFIVGPLLIMTITYFTMYFGIFPRLIGVNIPWTTPYFISGFLATGGRIGGVILQIINFCVAFIIWFPFLKSWDKRLVLEEQGEVPAK